MERAQPWIHPKSTYLVRWRSVSGRCPKTEFQFVARRWDAYGIRVLGADSIVFPESIFPFIPKEVSILFVACFAFLSILILERGARYPKKGKVMGTDFDLKDAPGTVLSWRRRFCAVRQNQRVRERRHGLFWSVLGGSNGRWRAHSPSELFFVSLLTTRRKFLRRYGERRLTETKA